MDVYSDTEHGFDYDINEDSCDEEITASKDQCSAEHKAVLDEDLLQEINKIIEAVASMITVPRSHARELLQYYRWEENEVYDKFYGAGSDINALCKLASITAPNQKQIVANEDIECGACTSDISSDMVTIECGHMFCKACVLSHWNTGIEERRPLLTCLDCECLLDDELIDSLITDGKMKTAYCSRIVGSFVESSKDLQCCPASDCPYVMNGSGGYAAEVACKCGQNFCFDCGNLSHVPISCKLLRLWMKKREDYYATAVYLQANTKDCPNCGTLIEKEGWSSRITCYQESCGHIFCWLCLKPYSDSNHLMKCAYHVKRSKKNTTTRNTVENYLIQYDRWANHFNWLKHESKLKETVQAKMQEISGSTQINMCMAETKFLVEAQIVLVKARKTLMDTYIFSFFTDTCPEKELFLKNQTDMERATRELSGLLEGDLARVKNMDTFHTDVQSLSRYCTGRCDALIKQVEEGNENEIWQYNATD